MVRKIFIISIIFLLKDMISPAQNKPVQIEVKDKTTKELLPFAVIKITTDSAFFKGAITDMEGKAIAELPDIPFAIEALYVGYKTVKRTYSAKEDTRKLTIELEPLIVELTECVITGNRNDNFTTCIYRCGGAYCTCCPGMTITEYKTDSVQEVKKIYPTATLKCYPNPTDGPVNIEWTGEIKQLLLTDAVGKIVEQYNLQEIRKLNVDIGNYAPGVYFLSYSDGEKIYSERVILAR